MGLDVYLYTGQKEIELPSTKYPDHLFKIGYFRSSYNESGANRVMRDLCGFDLYSIFGKEGTEYEFTPDWASSRARAIEAVEAMRTQAEKFPYCVMQADGLFSTATGAKSSRDALDILRAEIERHGGDKDFGSYSSRNGYFFIQEPIHVVAVIPGTAENLFVGKSSANYVIYKADLVWYVNALEIVIETIDYVLANGTDSFSMRWSG